MQFKFHYKKKMIGEQRENTVTRLSLEIYDMKTQVDQFNILKGNYLKLERLQ